jgi:hypothetical protein
MMRANRNQEISFAGIEITHETLDKTPSCIPSPVEDVFQVRLIDLQSPRAFRQSNCGYFDPC